MAPSAVLFRAVLPHFEPVSCSVWQPGHLSLRPGSICGCGLGHSAAAVLYAAPESLPADGFPLRGAVPLLFPGKYLGPQLLQSLPDLLPALRLPGSSEAALGLVLGWRLPGGGGAVRALFCAVRDPGPDCSPMHPEAAEAGMVDALGRMHSGSGVFAVLPAKGHWRCACQPEGNSLRPGAFRRPGALSGGSHPGCEAAILL